MRPLALAAGALLLPLAASAASLTVTPSAVGSTYGGKVTIQVGGLASGETVNVRKYADANANGIVDSTDFLVLGFQLTDGVAATVGGVTNLNVPCDYSPTNGIIVAPIDFTSAGVGQAMVAQYAYVVSSPTGSFTPVTNIFTVTNAAYAQSISGTVLSGGTNVPYANVMLFTPPSDNGGFDFVAGTLANASGAYSITAPAGSYLMLSARSGYVADASVAPVVTLNASASLSTNLSLAPADRTISGRMVDAATNALEGMLVVCEGDNGLAIGFASTNGDFSVPVTAGQWRVGTDDRQIAFYGCLRPDESTNVDTSAGSVAGITVAFPRFTALIYGSIVDDHNQPLTGVRMQGQQDNGSGPYQADATSDLNGNYTLGVAAGSWRANVDNFAAPYSSYIFSTMDDTNISAGQALRHNFVGAIATNHIMGYVRDSGGNPISNVWVSASAMLGTNLFNTGNNTDTNGAYSFLVANGNWTLNLDCGYLSSLGFTNCPASKSTNVLNGDVVVNFIASTLHVTTTNLANGTMGVSYNQALAASGGQAPYTWSLDPNWTVAPFGLTLSTGGVLSGTPTNYGSSFFGVVVTDNQGATAEQYFSLYVYPPPLVITTSNLPAGTNGQFYSQNLNVTGGTPPYNWYLPNAPLPAGLSLSTNGILSGTPGTNGNFNFYVAVYGSGQSQNATQQLSLTIYPAALHVTTTSPLPDGTRNSSYYTSFAASGGVPPYTWSLAPGSPSLPSGLTLSTNGSLSGTPVVAGGFWFTTRVTDSIGATNDWMLSLSINEPATPGLTLTGVSRPAAGQFQFTFSTGIGTNYTIQYSSDLRTWTPVLTIGGSGGPLTIIDPSATVTQRFYRVKIGP